MTTALEHRRECLESLLEEGFKEKVLKPFRQVSTPCSEEIHQLAKLVNYLAVCQQNPVGSELHSKAQKLCIESFERLFDACSCSERVGDFAQFLLNKYGDKKQHEQIFLAVADLCAEKESEGLHTQATIQHEIAHKNLRIDRPRPLKETENNLPWYPPVLTVV